MAYNKEELYQQALGAIEKHKLMFIEDIVAYIPCVISTFYEHFPKESKESKELKRLLEINRISTKNSLRNKWEESDNPTLQIALYKTICTDEERRRLNTSHTDITTKGEKLNVPILSIDPINNAGNDSTK